MENRITADHLYQINVIKSCVIAPNGKFVIYSVQHTNKETEKKYTKIYRAETKGKQNPQQLTFGKYNDTQPAISPKGKKLVFISNRLDPKQSQIFLMHLKKGGDAKALTNVDMEIANLCWHPEEKYLLFSYRKTPKLSEDEQKKGAVCRHYTRTFFKYDGAGYLPEKAQWHLAILKLKTGKITLLTENDDFSEHSAAWSPDGKAIVFVSNRHVEPELHSGKDDLFLLDIATKEIKKIETPEGPIAQPTFSPDGQYIAYVGKEEAQKWYKNNNVWVVGTNKANAQPRCLTEKYDIHVESGTLNDTIGTPPTPLIWSKDGSYIYFTICKHGSNTLYAVDLKEGSLREVFTQKGLTALYSLDKKQKKLAFVYANMQNIGDIYVKKLKKDKIQPITQLNKSWLKEITLSAVEEVWIKGNDNNDIQAWVMFPPNFNPSKTYPSILQIHGGPLLQYGEAFMHEFYYLAAQGYIVYFSNPRGGQGYGEAHARAIWGKWGSADYDDLMSLTNYMSNLPFIDTERMGVTGGSYGGYMTNWIIGHTHCFKAAVTQRCVSNFISMWGSSDVNWVFQDVVSGTPPWENVEHYWNMSPMKYIGNAQTPTLVIHSEKDYRCCIEQGEQVYVALKRIGVDTEFVVFPDEPHGLSREGRTDRRIARLKHILRWFNRYLK